MVCLTLCARQLVGHRWSCITRQFSPPLNLWPQSRETLRGSLASVRLSVWLLFIYPTGGQEKEKHFRFVGFYIGAFLFPRELAINWEMENTQALFSVLPWLHILCLNTWSTLTTFCLLSDKEIYSKFTLKAKVRQIRHPFKRGKRGKKGKIDLHDFVPHIIILRI